EALRLEDDLGNPVPITVRGPFNGSNGNHFRVEPGSPLAPDTIHHLIMDPGAGLPTIDGRTRLAPFETTFRTRAAGAASACEVYPADVGEPLAAQSPPAPEADAGVHPNPMDSTGCSAGGAGSGGAPLLLFLSILTLLVRRKENAA